MTGCVVIGEWISREPVTPSLLSVVEVCCIDEWLPARQGETLESESGRYQFVGHLANDELRERYKGQSVADLALGQNPIRYVGGA